MAEFDHQFDLQKKSKLWTFAVKIYMLRHIVIRVLEYI